MRNLSYLFAVMLFLVPSYVCAEPAHADFGKFSAGVGGGAVIPRDTSFSISGSITGSGDIHYKDSAAVLGIAGYHINNYLTGEAQFAYSSVDYDKISGTLTAGSLGTGSGDIGIDGHTDVYVGMFNAIATPLGVKGLSPFLGAGVGFAVMDSKINSMSFQGTTSAINSSNSDAYLAANGLAGVNYTFANNFSIGGRYQYLWINSGSSSSGGGVTGKEDDVAAHVITAHVTYTF